MKKLIIFSTILFVVGFLSSIAIIISYIFEINGLKGYLDNEGLFSTICFFLFLFFCNTGAFFFPVYYLEIVSYFRKKHRLNKVDNEERKESEPYLFDTSKYLYYAKKIILFQFKQDRNTKYWKFYWCLRLTRYSRQPERK